MELYLLRHGQTEANVARINQGHQDGKLTEQGVWQAARVAQRLKDVTFDLIVVSDLGRTKETAAPIIATHPEAEVVYEPRVRERNQGVFEGRPYGTFTEAAKEAGIHITEYRPEGGESVTMLRQRAEAYLKELIEEHRQGRVLVVTHGGFLVQALFHLMGMEDSRENYERLHPHNTALSIMRIDDEGACDVELLNCTAHL